ncbi:stalk domain-containing protein [Cohnella thailandensis]|uniref:Copper amine oxidase N-terminal domain-containing protein n=1 Tax=Cohnella thailandensis TaxID=557557 RepID=A0A841T0F2_9BACL|nr:stalk domain-containing protein [Cohnella thailandensis]MBB6635560.1 copper amine oxidase N-terminal domain-containing protein [Cohnella thailandensis]MBP1974940.1 PKD repeat protein [Cohnella thailandensis]
MRKWFAALLLLSLVFSSIPFSNVAEAKPGDNTLSLYLDKAKVALNGVEYPSVQPTTAVKGVSYAPLSMLVARYGYSISFNSVTKESIVTGNNLEMRWKMNTSTYTLNGVSSTFAGKAYVLKGSLMVPVRAWATATGSTLTTSKGQIVLAWNSFKKPTAEFVVDQTEIYATQTNVTYTSKSQNPEFIVQEEWTGNDPAFNEPGSYTITRTVMDTNGEWSEPYSVTINVLPPNQAPVAEFTTDKTVYKIGEPITYTDLSTDDENAIVERVWSNNDPAFFTSGPQMINLRVLDKHGLYSDYSLSVTISDEIMYTQEEYNQKFIEPGEMYTTDGQAILNYSLVPYTFSSSDRKLLASNSPENLTKQGLLYRDTVTGDFRLFVYHLNIGTDKLKIYLAATNKSSEVANVSLGASGQAGPNYFGLWTGKLASERYLDSNATGNTTLTSLQPGETKLIMPELGNQALKPYDVFSAYADLNASSAVEFTLFAVKEGDKAPLETLKTFGNLPRDAKHIRGTFDGADRTIHIDEVLGDEPQRVLFGDHVNDPSLDGRDMLNGVYENNWGNFGVVYKMTVRVKPNTLIAANARGGVWSGVFKINDIPVMVSNSSLLQKQSDVCVLYRTGPYEEFVELSFMTALGSNLPMNVLFIPMKQG